MELLNLGDNGYHSYNLVWADFHLFFASLFGDVRLM